MPTGTGGKTDGVLLLDTSTAIALLVEDHEAHVATVTRPEAVGSVSPRTPGSRPIRS